MRRHLITLWLHFKERKLVILIAAALIGFVWLVTFGDQGLYQLHQSYKLKTDLNNKIDELNNKIKDLKIQKDLLNDPVHLELVIRQELGYVKQGEVVFQKME